MENTELKPWIELRVQWGNQLKNLDELEADLNSLGSLHKRTVWLPACGSGSLLVLVFKFGVASVLSGITYDLMKKMCKKLVTSLEKFYKGNPDYNMDGLKIEYDDITFEFFQLSASDIAHVGKFFNSLPEVFEFFAKHDINHIDLIQIPSYPEQAVSDAPDEDKEEDIFRYWKIRYDYGLNTVYYDSHSKQLLEF